MDVVRFRWIPVALYVAWLGLAYEFHFLDYVNLTFHEAGHVFLAPFGPVLGMLGGTLGQLFFPVVCGVHFLREGKRASALVCGVWFSESLMYVAHYMADAREMSLPLVGGEIHDWNWLLGRMGWLDATQVLAGSLHFVAFMLATSMVVALAYSDRRNLL